MQKRFDTWHWQFNQLLSIYSIWERERELWLVLFIVGVCCLFGLLSFSVLVPIIYAIVIELDVLIRKNCIHEHCSQPYAFKCTLTSCTLISAVTGKHIYKKTMPITSLHFKGCLIFVRIIGYIFFNRPTRIYYSLLTKFWVKAIVKRQAVA